MTDRWSRIRVPLIVFCSVGLLVCVTILVLALHFAFFSNRDAGISTAHPSSARVVQKYLTALSTGDARTAESLDAGVLSKSPYVAADHATFLTDSALGSARSRISHVASVVTLASGSTATVRGSWTLAGKHYTSLFSLDWDKASAKWILQDSLANVVSITSYSTNGVIANPPFSLGATQAAGGTRYVAYPGVYRLSVDITASALVDAAKTPSSRELTVVPFDAVPMHDITFLVTAQP
jgi:hypothetical protein